MRSVSVAACVALLLVGAVSAIDSQAQARAIEDRWKNCSQIVHGRLGALHDADDDPVSKSFWSMSANGYTIQFSPCVKLQGGSYLVVTPVNSNTTTNAVTQFVFDKMLPVTDERFITFNMPEKSGDVANIVATYTASPSNPQPSPKAVIVTVSCNSSATTAWATNFSITTGVLNIQSINGCARFPYTNKSMPAGGVAALIVVILCFILEFGACFKYHRDNKNTSPLDEESMH